MAKLNPVTFKKALDMNGGPIKSGKYFKSGSFCFRQSFKQTKLYEDHVSFNKMLRVKMSIAHRLNTQYKELFMFQKRLGFQSS